MQEALLKWDAKCLPKYGADGDFGKETEAAVKAFQTASGLPATGVYDEVTRAKLTGVEPVQAHKVEVTGGSVNVRSAPGTNGTRILGTVHKGDSLPWQGESRIISGTPWHLIEYKGQNGWISGKYSRVV
jgi:peptidoglycan hydrolase-like protein with peptidoglycan-binding domain